MAYKDKYPSVLLEDAVEAISSLPGVGKKGALRLALHLLKQPQENVHHFASAVNRLRDEVKYCRECSMISDGDVCSICSDRSRDHRTICVVESVGGIISPIEGIGPSDLTISRLVERVRDMVDLEGNAPSDVEIIFAMSGDVEGETTAFYIYRQISGLGVRVSSIARGLGFGDDLEYADELTLGRSIVNRQAWIRLSCPCAAVSPSAR